MYRVAHPPGPRKPWLLRCLESGAAYPNGVRQNGRYIIGQHAKRFDTAGQALAYARKYRIDVEQERPEVVAAWADLDVNRRMEV